MQTQDQTILCLELLCLSTLKKTKLHATKWEQNNNKKKSENKTYFSSSVSDEEWI